MPEGDSYTAAARRMRPVLVERPILEVDGSAPAVRKHSAALQQATVTAVRTLGKHLLIDLDDGSTIHVHLGMSGHVRVRTGTAIPTGRQRGALRLGLRTEVGGVAVMAAPTVEIDRRLRVEMGLEYLGPDVLAPEFDFDRFETQASRYPDDASVSDFLLDQRVMAGIGNVYKSEVLFLEKLHPDRPMATVDMDTRGALARRARRIMYPNRARGERNTTGRRSPSLWVYGRDGEPCLRCRTAITGDFLGAPERVTYWCPTCQL